MLGERNEPPHTPSIVEIATTYAIGRQPGQKPAVQFEQKYDPERPSAIGNYQCSVGDRNWVSAVQVRIPGQSVAAPLQPSKS